MARIAARKETGKLFFDFFYEGMRCREQTDLDASPKNKKRLEAILHRIEAEIALGSFEYRRYFPNSRLADRAELKHTAKLHNERLAPSASVPALVSGVPNFTTFSDIWLGENEVRWRRTTRGLRRDMLKAHLIPRFGDCDVSKISRADLLQYRSELAKRPGKQKGTLLSPKTINDIVGMLSAILDEAAGRYEFTSPAALIKRLKVPRKDIQPFSLEEVWTITRTCREDYGPYFTMRFFTGMRTGEVHGLKWRHVDFERRQILVRETFTHGAQDYTKNDGSQREIEMSQHVFDALIAQRSLTGAIGEYVFCARNGEPLDTANFTDRVWYPLLRHLGLEVRRPYQMRHTAATLWLAAGENPEWIARQLGHSTTEMLFRVYSRYVPNLTRRDGSAFERMLAASGTLAQSSTI